MCVNRGWPGLHLRRGSQPAGRRLSAQAGVWFEQERVDREPVQVKGGVQGGQEVRQRAGRGKQREGCRSARRAGAVWRQVAALCAQVRVHAWARGQVSLMWLRERERACGAAHVDKKCSRNSPLLRWRGCASS